MRPDSDQCICLNRPLYCTNLASPFGNTSWVISSVVFGSCITNTGVLCTCMASALCRLATLT